MGWCEGKAKRSDGKALVRALDAKGRPSCRPMAGVDVLRRANQQREIDWSGLPTVTCRREAPQRRGAIKALAHHQIGPVLAQQGWKLADQLLIAAGTV